MNTVPKLAPRDIIEPNELCINILLISQPFINEAIDVTGPYLIKGLLQ